MKTNSGIMMDPIEGVPELEPILRDPWIRTLAQNAAQATLMSLLDDPNRAEGGEISALAAMAHAEEAMQASVNRSYAITTTGVLQMLLLDPEIGERAVEIVRLDLEEGIEEFDKDFQDDDPASSFLRALLGGFEITLLKYANKVQEEANEEKPG